ncbi:MAG: amidohydrolase family protein [Acidimicrobiia bacterium]
MTSSEQGTRGIYAAEKEASLPYRVWDADHHIYPPADARIRHLPAKYHDRLQQTTGRITPEVEGDDEEHIATTIGTHTVPEGGHGGVDLRELPGMEGNIPIPGAMLNKLNPMKDLDQLTRAELVDRYNAMRPAFERKEPRLKLMDIQGVDAAVVHTGGFGHEPAFNTGDMDLGAAVTRAWNEYILEDWGFNTDNRIYCPMMIPFADLDLAIAELEWGLARGAKFINLPVDPTQRGISPFDPYYDPFWARVNEAEVRAAIHLHFKARHDGMAQWSEDPTTPYPRYDAMQWTLWWSDRPIMEMVGAMVFQGLFQRFPKVKVLIAEYGSVWLPYLLRKMDHAAMLGRKPTFVPKLQGRPSGIFKEHVVIAPYPEENVSRVADVTGWDCLVFGSDFPHSEGLPDPVQYVATLQGIDEARTRKLMRDNLYDFING